MDTRGSVDVSMGMLPGVRGRFGVRGRLWTLSWVCPRVSADIRWCP